MKLYGSTLSPFVRKAAAILNEKGLDFELVPVDFQSPDPAFRAASPLGKMPGFEDGDFKIGDSTAIAVYLDAQYSEPRLIPDEPKARAQTFWWDEFADTMLCAAGGKLFFNRIVAPRFLKRAGDEAVAKQGEAELAPMLDYLEKQVPDAGGFLLGDSIGLADISVASPFMNLEHAGAPLTDAHPRVKAWVQGILARPSFASMCEQERRMLAA